MNPVAPVALRVLASRRIRLGARSCSGIVPDAALRPKVRSNGP